jgi:hypothetical protein
MMQFLMNTEVEGHISLAEGNSVLRYNHPTGKYTVFLRDLQVEPASNPPLLSVQITFDDATLNEAREVGTNHLKEFLDYLVLVTNNTFRCHRVMQVFNWEAGSGMRDCMYYAGFVNHDVPTPGLNSDLLQTVMLLQGQPVQPRLRRALKWFGYGVGSTSRDDQFTYFWFVIELIAQIIKMQSPVPDRCPVCREPLFCPTCQATQLHRPYPKQAIHQLFARYLGAEWEAFYPGAKWESFYGQASEVRNRLMHGEDVPAIEAALELDLSDLVNKLGQLAWTAIINQFAPGLDKKYVSFLTVNQYVHMNLRMGAHMQVGFMPNFSDPRPEHFPDVKLSMTQEPATRPQQTAS